MFIQVIFTPLFCDFGSLHIITIQDSLNLICIDIRKHRRAQQICYCTLTGTVWPCKDNNLWLLNRLVFHIHLFSKPLPQGSWCHQRVPYKPCRFSGQILQWVDSKGAFFLTRSSQLTARFEQRYHHAGQVQTYHILLSHSLNTATNQVYFTHFIIVSISRRHCVYNSQSAARYGLGDDSPPIKVNADILSLPCHSNICSDLFFPIGIHARTRCTAKSTAWDLFPGRASIITELRP